MTTVTIPKNMVRKDDLVVIPRKKYEKLLLIAEHMGDLDSDLEEALCEVKSGKRIGPFSSVRGLRTSLES